MEIETANLVDRSKSQPTHEKLPLKELWPWSRDPLNFGPQSYLWNGYMGWLYQILALRWQTTLKLGTSNMVYRLILASTTAYMIDHPVMELSSGSCDLFNFGEINYILKIVQDRDIVMVED